MATKRSKKNTNVLIKNAENLKATTKNVHDKALNLTDTLVDETLAMGEQWQGLFAKALDSSVKLLGKQQNLMFSTLESIKGQYTSDRNRLKNILGWGKDKAEKETKKPATKAKDLTIKTQKVVVKKTRTVAKKAKAVVKTTTAKATSGDNFKVIKGVGPKIEQLLNEAGITTYAQLAKAKVSALKEVMDTAGPRYKNYDTANLRKEAQQLAAKK